MEGLWVLDRAGVFSVIDVDVSQVKMGSWGMGAVESMGKVEIVGGAGAGGLRYKEGFVLDLFTADPTVVTAEVEYREPGYEEKEIAGEGLYKGNVEEGEREGKGLMEYKNGDVYEGDWGRDKRHGSGALRCANGTVYEGEWSKGARSGQGKSVWAEPSASSDAMKTLAEYQGSFENDNPTGDGRGLFVDGCVYEGTFKDSLPHGNGCLVYAGGGTVRGVFSAGEISQGQETFPNGESYEGKFELGKRGVRTGDAIVVTNDGSVYEGGYRNNRRNGFGKFTCGKTGTEYQGKWVGGHRNGNGAETTASGHKFVGLWKDDLKNGDGQLVTKEGEVTRGLWKAGEFVEQEEKKD